MPDADTLLELYRIAVDEYRFQVRLNWDRTREYLILNLAILSVATGLLKIEGFGAANFFVMLIFAVGVMTSIVGIVAIRRGHVYFRRTVYKKTLIEDLVGLRHPIDGHSHPLASLSIETTTGMSASKEILGNTESWLQRPVDRRHILTAVIGLLVAMAAIDATGCFYALSRSTRLASTSSRIDRNVTTSASDLMVLAAGDIAISKVADGFVWQLVQTDGRSRDLGRSSDLASAISAACMDGGARRLWLYFDDGSRSRIACPPK